MQTQWQMLVLIHTITLIRHQMFEFHRSKNIITCDLQSYRMPSMSPGWQIQKIKASNFLRIQSHSWKVNKSRDCDLKLHSVAKSVCGGCSQTKLLLSSSIWYQRGIWLCVALQTAKSKNRFQCGKEFVFSFPSSEKWLPAFMYRMDFCSVDIWKEHHIIITVSVRQSSRSLFVILSAKDALNRCRSQCEEMCRKMDVAVLPRAAALFKCEPTHTHSSFGKISNGRLERWKAIIRFYASFFHVNAILCVDEKPPTFFTPSRNIHAHYKRPHLRHFARFTAEATYKESISWNLSSLSLQCNNFKITFQLEIRSPFHMLCRKKSTVFHCTSI